MPDDSAFLRAIAAAPDDDAPRLVYADYLEESGDPSRLARAELIRHQVAAARARPDDPRAGEAVPTLLAEHWISVWDYTLPRVPYVRWGPYRRGFIDEVTLGAVGFYVYGDRVLRAIPLRRLRLNSCTPIEVRRLLTGEEIREVPELWLVDGGWTYVSASALPVLADAGPWPALRQLGVQPATPGMAPPEAVVHSLPRLREKFGDRLVLPPGWDG